MISRQESALAQGSVIVVDVGKTVAKISLWSRDGQCIDRRTRPNASLPNASLQGSPCPSLDLAALAAWLEEALGAFAGHPVEAIVPVTHGAAIAGIRGDVLAFATPDYEWEMPAEMLADYRAQRDPFAVTGSPALPMGLNLGAQLHWLEAQGALDGATLMPLPQYWAWWLSGTAVSEATSLGCHSDLWAPATGQFSPMAQRRGWAGRFAPVARAGDVIGTLRPGLAERTGLSPRVRVHAGLHDSNAALLAARNFPAIGGHEATVLSTGTWFIAMRSPASPVNLATLEEARDCLVNVDAFGQPVPSARFMGGREVELLGDRIDHGGTHGLADALLAGAMVLPSQVPGCGPFPQSIGRWINRPADAEARAAAIALYAALMADASLSLIGARERLLVEGRFAGSEIFVRALAELRPQTQVLTANAEADVSFGALTLALPGLAPQGTLEPVEPLGRDLAGLRGEWLETIEDFA